jgi:ATP-dependent DNA ligase
MPKPKASHLLVDGYIRIADVILLHLNANLPEPKNARRGEAMTREVMAMMQWLKPRLVAQVEFTEWTSNDHLCHAKFVALCDDKRPAEVVREFPASRSR